MCFLSSLITDWKDYRSISFIFDNTILIWGKSYYLGYGFSFFIKILFKGVYLSFLIMESFLGDFDCRRGLILGFFFKIPDSVLLFKLILRFVFPFDVFLLEREAPAVQLRPWRENEPLFLSLPVMPRVCGTNFPSKLIVPFRLFNKILLERLWLWHLFTISAKD